jgi:DNA-binding transcriptional MerR regulator
MNTVAVSQRTGFTVRQLQYMDERGVVCPEIKRHARIYRPAQVRFLFLLRRLVDKGFMVRQVIGMLRQVDADLQRSRARWLVTDGVNYQLHPSTKDAWLNLYYAARPCVLIDIPSVKEMA